MDETTREIEPQQEADSDGVQEQEQAQQEQSESPTEQTQAQDPNQPPDELLDPDEDEPASVPYSRFNEVYYQKKKAEKELAEMRERQAQTAPVSVDESNKPRLEQFDYDEEKYNDALLDWKLEQRDKQNNARQQQAQQQQKFHDFGMKQQRYMQKNPQYQQLAAQADAAGVQFNEPLVEMILNSDTGVQIHHHLLSNPDKLERLNSGNPLAAMRELVRLENTFSKQKPKPVTKAPDPITPSGGGARDSKPGNDRLGKMSPQEYYEYRMNQKKG